jgi:hypothetical protein
MKQLFIWLAIAVSSVTATAQQSIDLFTVSARYGFPSSYERNLNGKATEYGGLANLKFAAVLSESFIWVSDLSYIYSYVTSDMRMLEDVVNPVRLHGFILQTGMIRKFDNGRALWVILTPRFMTDFFNADMNCLQPGGTFLYEKKFNEQLTMRFGAMYNNEFSGPLVVPLVFINWQISSRWNITGQLPISSKISYRAGDRITLGLGHFGLITSYRLGNPDTEKYYMEKTSIDITASCRYRLVGNVHVEGRIGYALGRTYEQYESDQKVDFRLSIISFGDNRLQKNINFNDGPIASIRLIYNLPLQNKNSAK